MQITSNPTILAVGGAKPPSPPPQPSQQPAPLDGFVGGVYHGANDLVRLEGRMGGVAGALGVTTLAVQTAEKLAQMTTPVTMTGVPGAVAAVCILTTACAIGYAGWKGGGMVTDKALERLDKAADSCHSQAASTAIKTLPRVAVAVGVAAFGAVTLNAATLNLALPAAAYVGGYGLVAGASGK